MNLSTSHRVRRATEGHARNGRRRRGRAWTGVLLAAGFLTALALLILRLARPAFRFAWLVAIGGALLAWITVFIWQAQMPLSLALPPWQPASLFADSPAFMADGLAWLLTALWGFRQGARWLWWTFAATGTVRFAAALGAQINR